jgi:hypothetical protein
LINQTKNLKKERKERKMSSEAHQLLRDTLVTLTTECPSLIEAGSTTSLRLLSICGGLNNETFDICMTNDYLEKILEKNGEEITFFRNTCIHFRKELLKLNVETIAVNGGVKFIERSDQF